MGYLPYKIYQLRNPEGAPWAFKPFRIAVRYPINLFQDYEVVSQGTIDPRINYRDTFTQIQKLYSDLARIRAREPGYKGTVLSMSDIVRVGDSYYYCSATDWVEIPDEWLSDFEADDMECLLDE